LWHFEPLGYGEFAASMGLSVVDGDASDQPNAAGIYTGNADWASFFTPSPVIQGHVSEFALSSDAFVGELKNLLLTLNPDVMLVPRFGGRFEGRNDDWSEHHGLYSRVSRERDIEELVLHKISALRMDIPNLVTIGVPKKKHAAWETRLSHVLNHKTQERLHRDPA
jgi:hypothetical protein